MLVTRVLSLSLSGPGGGRAAMTRSSRSWSLPSKYILLLFFLLIFFFFVYPTCMFVWLNLMLRSFLSVDGHVARVMGWAAWARSRLSVPMVGRTKKRKKNGHLVDAGFLYDGTCCVKVYRQC